MRLLNNRVLFREIKETVLRLYIKWFWEVVEKLYRAARINPYYKYLPCVSIIAINIYFIYIHTHIHTHTPPPILYALHVHLAGINFCLHSKSNAFPMCNT